MVPIPEIRWLVFHDKSDPAATLSGPARRGIMGGERW